MTTQEPDWFDATICLECDGDSEGICGVCCGTGASPHGPPPGDFRTWKCSSCNGTGTDPCDVCWGDGLRDPYCPRCDLRKVEKLCRTDDGIRCPDCLDADEEYTNVL